jgi:glycopeptide antibiotics resistance protein
LFPGSIAGWIIYSDLTKQPQLTNDFMNISSNHFYIFFILSIFGILSYSKHKKLNLLIKYLIILSVVLELSHLLIPQRSFQFGDLFGNILGVVLVLLINKIYRSKI